MADQPVTREKLINADIDVENLGKAVNEKGVVNPRYGDSYPTLPSAIQAVIETGGFEPFETEVGLLASTPILEKKAAKALDTKKIWLYVDGVWKDTGLSEFDQAKEYVDRLIKYGQEDGLVITSEDGFFLPNPWGDVPAIDKSELIEANLLWTGFEAIYRDGFSALPPPEKNTNLTHGDLKIFNIRAGIIGVAAYGQSLANGGSTGSSVSSMQPYSNLMLAGGVKRKPTEAGYIANAFLSLVEDGTQETPVTGFANNITMRMVAKGYLASETVLAGIGAAVNGRLLEELKKGTLHYANFMQMVRDTFTSARATGRSYALHFVQWKQGEAEYLASGINGTTVDIEYSQELQRLINDVAADVAAITNQKFQPNWIISQTGTHRVYRQETQFIALGLLRISEAMPNVYLSYPDYFIPKVSDGVHMTASGSWLAGAYDASVATEIMKGKDWKPFHVKNVSWQGSVLMLDCHVPVAPIQFSTLDCRQVPNQGFDIWEDGTLSNIITSVEVVGDMGDKIKIVCSREPLSNAELRIAFGRIGDPSTNDPKLSGALTNVHDSNSTIVTSPNNINYTLRNYLIINQFKKGI